MDNILFYLSIVLFVGFIVGKLVSLIKLPNVTGYLIAGLLIGPYILGFVPKDTISKMELISEVALGIIAFNTGSEFSIEHLKELGLKVITVTLLQSLGALVVVLVAMSLIFNQTFPFSIVIATIATATAPAATLLVIKQYQAKGPVVDTLLPVVALDDAVCIILFSIAASVAKLMINPAVNTSIIMTILTSLWEIVLAIIIGIACGFLICIFKSKLKGEGELLLVTFATILITVALSNMFNASELIACMMVGTIVTNFIPNSLSVFNSIERISLPIYVAFFTLSGADLDLSILKSVGIVGIGYIIARAIGKIAGAYLGAKVTKMPDTVQKYLGITLLPQAGVAIGLSLTAQSILPEYSSAIRTIVLSATLVYELIGPVLTKIALVLAKEIKTPNTKIKKQNPRPAV